MIINFLTKQTLMNTWFLL